MNQLDEWKCEICHKKMNNCKEVALFTTTFSINFLSKPDLLNSKSKNEAKTLDPLIQIGIPICPNCLTKKNTIKKATQSLKLKELANILQKKYEQNIKILKKELKTKKIKNKALKKIIKKSDSE